MFFCLLLVIVNRDPTKAPIMDHTNGQPFKTDHLTKAEELGDFKEDDYLSSYLKKSGPTMESSERVHSSSQQTVTVSKSSHDTFVQRFSFETDYGVKSHPEESHSSAFWEMKELGVSPVLPPPPGFGDIPVTQQNLNHQDASDKKIHISDAADSSGYSDEKPQHSSLFAQVEDRHDSVANQIESGKVEPSDRGSQHESLYPLSSTTSPAAKDTKSEQEKPSHEAVEHSLESPSLETTKGNEPSFDAESLQTIVTLGETPGWVRSPPPSPANEEKMPEPPSVHHVESPTVVQQETSTGELQFSASLSCVSLLYWS
ncbi:hypothetical protein AB6A40_002290 [Gnathostoma spinigerum]|uniref:Uncharacterized protein n=1 Tax=Gnathostoma spinigerum TaxID=75299 RepID=A0ABD6EDX0_9BILA